jgi:hypothetical protein
VPHGDDEDPVARLGGGRASIDHVCVAGMSLASAEGAIAAWPAPEHVGHRLSDHHGVVVDLNPGHAVQVTPVTVGQGVAGGMADRRHCRHGSWAPARRLVGDPRA